MFKSTTHMHGNIYNDSNILNSQKHESNQSRTTTSIIQDWEEPIQVTNFDVDARDYGSGIKSHEFNDTPITLQKKVHVLAQLIRQSKSGIDDYATKAKEESVTAAGRKLIKDWKLARPTLTHRVLVSMFTHGHLSHWIQQNHDSLPQKAGYPQHALNEIHGSLHDPANPIVPYEGTLRDDLYEWMHEWQEKTDLCLSLGTSMSGFNCDSVPQRCAERINGLVIINLQQTSYDDQARLRIFAKTDDVFRMLAKELNLTKMTQNIDSIIGTNIYQIPFNDKGYPTTIKKEYQILNLNIGEYIQLTGGPYKKDIGEIVSKNKYGHYRIKFSNSVNKTFNLKRKTFSLWMGSWWIEMITNGKGIVPGGQLPFLNITNEMKGNYLNTISNKEGINIDFSKYKKMLKIGLPTSVIRHKMIADHVDTTIVEQFIAEST
eukprot:GSChrysophyteH1.ASY1.ANO1.1942.1 assembled CDS